MANGGQIWLSTPVTKIHKGDGDVVTGIDVTRDGETVRIDAPVVVSDIGPAGTVELIGEENVPPDYQDLVKAADRPTSMITVNFASQERLIDVPGMLSFAKSRRLAYIANFTDVCPEMAPEAGISTRVPPCPRIPPVTSMRRRRPNSCCRTCGTTSRTSIGVRAS